MTWALFPDNFGHLLLGLTGSDDLIVRDSKTAGGNKLLSSINLCGEVCIILNKLGNFRGAKKCFKAALLDRSCLALPGTNVLIQQWPVFCRSFALLVCISFLFLLLTAPFASHLLCFDSISQC